MSGSVFTKVAKPASATATRRSNDPALKRNPLVRGPLKLRYVLPEYNPGAQQASGGGGATFDFTTIPIVPPNRAGIQVKLRVGEPNDQYEHEADRVADTVMRMTEPKVGHASPSGNRRNAPQIQRLCRQYEEEVRPSPLMAKEQEPLQKKTRKRLTVKRQTGLPGVKDLLRTNAGPGNTPGVTPKITANIESLKGGNQPLSESTRAFFGLGDGWHDPSDCRRCNCGRHRG